jgi:hypothetical protein
MTDTDKSRLRVCSDSVAPPDLPPDWQDADTWASWWLAHRIIGERVKAGAPVPPFFRSSKDSEGGPDDAIR